jgi:hypothetical protein
MTMEPPEAPLMKPRTDPPELVEEALIDSLDISEADRRDMYLQAAEAILRLNDDRAWPMPAAEAVRLLEAADRPRLLALQARQALRYARRAHPQPQINRRGL